MRQTDKVHKPIIILSNANKKSILIYLQTAPELRLSLQTLSQQASLSSVPNNPASHSSSPSTLKLPQNDSSGSEKHLPDFACSTFLIDRKLHGENLCK